jgi:hypothetical protein
VCHGRAASESDKSDLTQPVHLEAWAGCVFRAALESGQFVWYGKALLVTHAPAEERGQVDCRERQHA